MSQDNIKWTGRQKQAITARGMDLFVTASAGTGKTTVMSGRCAEIVSDKNICPGIGNILVLTFTDAAAEQMNLKIAEQLKSKLSGKADNRHLRRQIMLLQTADISTIHSFCRRIITENFYRLELDPTFQVIDSDEQRLLRAEALEKTVDWAWRQDDLAAGLRQLLYGRNQQIAGGFFAKIIDISNFLDGIPNRQKWYRMALGFAQTAAPLAGRLGQKQKQLVAVKLKEILAQLHAAEKLYLQEIPDGDWVEKCLQKFTKPADMALKYLNSGDWSRCAKEIKNFDKPRLNKPKGLSEIISELVRDTAATARDSFTDLSQWAVINPRYLDVVSRSANLQSRILIRLAEKFDVFYNQAKHTANCLDFADLEHYALKLLTAEDSQKIGPQPSQTALALQKKYKYIFVDEYQDINSVQKTILDLIRTAAGMFVVGDVKQSIYAFRGAEPKIFIDQINLSSTDAENARSGLRVDLNENWRSDRGILDFVNKVFSRIMTASFAGIDYDESARLRPAENAGKTSCGKTAPAVELHILDKQSKQPKTDSAEGDTEPKAFEERFSYSNRQLQAAMIANRIKQIVEPKSGREQFTVKDAISGKSRPAEYRDIVVLMRSPAGKTADYTEIFQMAGIPVSCRNNENYFETTEITDMLSLLKILDNPQRDIELAAVLRSPFFEVTDTELASAVEHCRRCGKKKNFHDCITEYCTSGDQQAGKIKDALQQLESWRTLARRGRLAELIWFIYRRTGYLSFVSALANGRIRRDNLLKLHARAVQFEGFISSGGIASLGRFIEFIEKLDELGRDWKIHEPSTAAENAVRIMSVHRSKGLEFPIVFLAELESHFNKRDITGDCLLDADDTIGLQIINPQSNSKLSSLTHQVIAEDKISAGLAEEMRIMYVAATRAKQRLILTACQARKTCRKTLSSGLLFSGKSLTDWQLRYSKNLLQWLLFGLCDQKCLHETFQTNLQSEAADDGLFSLRFYCQTDLENLAGDIGELKRRKSYCSEKPSATRSAAAGKELLERITQSINWNYRFAGLSKVAAKESVTEITHRSNEYAQRNLTCGKPEPFLPGRRSLAGQTSARLLGIATHMLLAKVDLSEPVTKQAIEKTKQKLIADSRIDIAAAERIDTNSIIGFFRSELGKAVLEPGNTILREWPFTIALPVSQCLPEMSPEILTTVCMDETVIVQGTVDVLIRTPRGIIIIDFKTDSVTAQQLPQRSELYRRQLQLYGKAAEAILGGPIAGKWLFFLSAGCEFEIK